MFKRAYDGDAKLQGLLERYGSMIAAKREKEKWKQRIRNQLVSKRLRFNSETLFVSICMRLNFYTQMEENMMRHRAILTGGIHKATYYNKPLPRMKVQPLHVSMMIHKRIRARARRLERQRALTSLMRHIETEAKFERILEKNAARFGQNFSRVFDCEGWRE